MDNIQSDYQKLDELVLPEYRSLIEKATNELIENDEPFNIEFKIKTADKAVIKDIHSMAFYSRKTKSIFGNRRQSNFYILRKRKYNQRSYTKLARDIYF